MGKIITNTDTENPINLTEKNLVLRGTSLKNTEYIIGLVV